MGMPEIFTVTIVIIHISVIALDFGGAIAVVTNRFQVARLQWWQSLYLSIVFAKGLSLILIDACPLTIAENFFRNLGHVDTSYGGSFVSHYLPRIPAELDFAVTCLLMLAGLVAVLRVGHQQIVTCLTTPHTRS